jgi:ATP-binding cassette subfamily B protein
MVDFAKLYRRVLEQLGSDGPLAWWLSIANIALVLALFAEPILFGKIIDGLTRLKASELSDTWPSLAGYLGVWVSFGLFEIVCASFMALHADRLAHRRRHMVLRSYFEHVLQLPASHYNSVHSGRLMKIMLQGVDSLWALWLGFFRDHMSSFIALIVLIPLSLYMNWRMALLLIALCTVFTCLSIFVVSKTQTLQKTVEQHHSDLAERANDALGNIALVQSFARIDQEVNAIKGISQKVLQAQFPVLSWWAVVRVLTRVSTTLAVLSMIMLGIGLFTQGLTTVGEIVTFIALATLVIGRLEQMAQFINRLAGDAPRLKEFFEVFDTVSHIKDAPTARDPGRLQGRIRFDQVTFSYDCKRDALKELTFSVEPGQTLALVGASGAGKSTALAMLYRAFDPQSGSISIDDIDIRQIKLDALRRNIGVVFQESLLFNRSVADNLRVGNPDASDDELIEAASSAQALDFIRQHPEGLGASIGERGRALSGGERQRLSIARVMLKDPPILILDEATSALDSQTETRLMQALEAVTKNRTTLVIAHRLATIKKADKILVLHAGTIVEAGNFEELMQRDGIFAQLARQQFAQGKHSSSDSKETE